MDNSVLQQLLSGLRSPNGALEEVLNNGFKIGTGGAATDMSDLLMSLQAENPNYPVSIPPSSQAVLPPPPAGDPYYNKAMNMPSISSIPEPKAPQGVQMAQSVISKSEPRHYADLENLQNEIRKMREDVPSNQDLLSRALLQGGLGMLANSNGTSFAEALGKGGQIGIDTYFQGKDAIKKRDEGLLNSLVKAQGISVDRDMSMEKLAQEAELARMREEGDMARLGMSMSLAEQNANRKKPLPTTVAKMQDDSLQGIGVLSNVNKDLEKLAGLIDSGKLDLSLPENLGAKGLNALGLSTEESRNLGTLTAYIEKLRNAILMQNKGVQTEGDADRALKEIVSSINDSKLVSKRLKEAIADNNRGIDLNKLRVDQFRTDYNQPEIDYSPYLSQKSSVIDESDDTIMVSPDGKKYNISADEVEEALKNGWEKVK